MKAEQALTVHPGPPKPPSTRERLLEATADLMCEGGLSAVTTQSIARNCGVSEGTIYRHFESREELIVTALRERLAGEFHPIIESFVSRAGHGQIDENIVGFMVSLLPIMSHISPVLGMLAADPALAAKNAAALQADGKGPGKMLDEVGEYFRREQQAGRIANDVDPKAAAALTVGVCFYRSLMQHLFQKDPTGMCDLTLSSGVASIVARGLQAPAVSDPSSPQEA